MLAALASAVLLIAVADRLVGHSNLAFAAAIILLIVVNAPILRFNCPTCGKNAFFRGAFAVPWPNRICSRCGEDLDRVLPKKAGG